MFVARPQLCTADCRLIELTRCADSRGSLTAIEGARHLPFQIARVFLLEAVPAGATRAGHATRRGVATLIHYPQAVVDAAPFARWRRRGAAPVAVAAARRVLSLPLHAHLRPGEQETVIAALHDCADRW